MSSYSVTIQMDQTTVNDLQSNGFNLYAFQAVQGASDGYPVVWFQTTTFALTTEVTWSEEYQAYTSSSQLIPNGEIVASNSYSASLGQTLNVSNSTGTGTVVETGTSGAISINNQTSTQFTCGISEQQPNGTYAPLCAFPLFGNDLDVIAPIEQVFLMFATTELNTGTVIEQSYGQGILINLTGTNSQTVSYDINGGWTWAGGGNWATTYPANENLVPLLIQPNS
ncbi:MAG TPA: hypothetical protein VHG08_20595 [Longimicrobium sp.]|nr:hypothetical protein [Longimicrobium sp.]